MRSFRNLAKNLLPYYLVKKYQAQIGSDAFDPGGYYSPIPSMEEIKAYNFNVPLPESLPAIDLNTSEQMNLLNCFEPYYNELPFPNEKTDGFRYYYKNDYYESIDAIILYCMIRHLTPHRIIEVGSGFSSSLMLDTNEKFLDNSIECTFIEPYPQRLLSVLKDSDKKSITIQQKKLQEIPMEEFQQLKKNDILFIDSTHVSKFNSDVNYIIHKILPILAHGVYIHFHDVYYPFEYPKDWLLWGRAWNEQYILRAFLQYNKEFKIVMFNTYLMNMFEGELKNRFPLLYNSFFGGSLWIQKI